MLIADANGGDEVLKLAVDNANRELAAFQQIRYWLRWPQPEFPRTSTGKVLRRTVQSWAQQTLASGGDAAGTLSDPLLDLLRELGAPEREFTASDRLAEDLHLDSLAMVQLQSALETRFGLELDDAVWGQVKTVGDLRGLLQTPRPGTVPAAGAPMTTAEQTTSSAVHVPCYAQPERDRIVFPRWPWWPVVRLVANRFSGSSDASAGMAGARPRIARPVLLPGRHC